MDRQQKCLLNKFISQRTSMCNKVLKAMRPFRALFFYHTKTSAKVQRRNTYFSPRCKFHSMGWNLHSKERNVYSIGQNVSSITWNEKKHATFHINILRNPRARALCLAAHSWKKQIKQPSMQIKINPCEFITHRD